MTTERNPDVKLDVGTIPDGMQLIEGKNLMQVARSRKIPFGVATRRLANHRQETIGLIIRDGDAERFRKALEAKAAAKEANRKTITTP